MKFRLSSIVLLLVVTIGWTQTETVWAAPLVQTDELDCSDSPFGRVLEVGSEREIFVGFRDADPSNLSIRPLDAFILDLNDGGDITFGQKKASGLNTKNGVEPHAAAAVDFNGDDYDEFFQAFLQSDGKYGAVVHVNGQGNADITDTWVSTAPAGLGHSRFAATSGNLQRNEDGNEAVAVLTRSATDAIHLNMFTGASDGTIAEPNGTAGGIWRSKEEDM